MSELPGGTVTFLFTDVQGSTRLWETAPDVMMGAMAQHDEVIESAVSVHNGHIVKPRGEGDSRFVVFPRASDALAAAVQVQQGFAATEWPTPSRILVRMALHTGVAELELGDYYGSAVNRAARLRGIGHGGQTLLSQATWELVRDHMPDGADIRDMGEHKLRDLTRPEHVYQVDIDGLQGSFPSLKSLDAIPNNLPEQLTEFVGREAELQEAKRLLEGSRLLTLLGPGGVGKSRLALQTAAEVSSAYEHGVYFVSLAPIDSVESIVPTIAEAVGVALSSDDDLQSQLLSYLRQKFQLLILDNFEHLHGGASLAAKILESAPGVSILAASRTKLNLSGETVLALSGLNIHWANAEEAMACEGVQMFIDAAQPPELHARRGRPRACRANSQRRPGHATRDTSGRGVDRHDADPRDCRRDHRQPRLPRDRDGQHPGPPSEHTRRLRVFVAVTQRHRAGPVHQAVRVQGRISA